MADVESTVATVSTVSTTTSVADALPAHPVTLTAAEVTGLVGLFQTMLDRTEKRILDAMTGNSGRAAERWAKHDQELAANTMRVTDRFASIDARLQSTVDALGAHLGREHDDDVRMDARIRPIRGSLGWLWTHWRDIVLLVIGLIALSTFLVDFIGHTFGTRAP